MKKLIFAVLLCVFISAYSQTTYFGKNKVQYTSFGWRVEKTDKFDIYYYPGGEEVASFVSLVAESSMAELETAFNYKLKRRVPIILYNSHKDFEETNVTTEILEELIGGFTESLKNRVVIPFTGSYEDLRHVVNHELVHAMQFEYLYGKGGTGAIVSSITYDVPLWFIEGSAEYFSRVWDKETDMYMRDAVVNDTLIDLVTLGYYSGGFFLYKAGESVLKFIADKYGREKIGEIYFSLKTTRSLDETFEKLLGKKTEELDNEWKLYLKKRYFPLIKNKDVLVENSKSLLGSFMETSPYNISPSVSPDGNYYAFISEKYGYFDIYVSSIFNPDRKEKVLPRTFVRHFESFHLDYGNLNWSRDSRCLVFSARNNEAEKIIVYDVRKKKTVKSVSIKADGVFSPAVDSKTEKVVYVKMNNGRNDIAVYDFAQKKEILLTNDIFDDRSPFFLNDSTIIFSSDMGEESLWIYGSYSIYLMNINSREKTKIELDVNASIDRFSLVNDSMVVFASYIGDISNVFQLNIETGRVQQLTDVITGCFNPSMSSDMSKLVFSFFSQMQMDVMILNNPSDNRQEIDLTYEYDDYIRKYNQYDFKPVNPQKPPFNFSVDWAAGAFSYTPGYGFVGLLDVGVSDMMGDNWFFLQMEKLSFSGSGYISCEYWFLKNRMDIALLFLNQEQEQFLTYYYSLSYIYNGGGILLRWPFDRYKRIDLQTSLYKYDVNENIYYTDGTVTDNLYTSVRSSHVLSFVYDNSIWGYFGPVNGDVARVDLGYEIDYDPKDSLGNFRGGYLSADVRKYFIITPRSQFAIRASGTTSFGRERMYSFIGGSSSLRGYNDYEFYGINTAFVNMELRFPLIDKIQFPIYDFSFMNIRGVVFSDLGIAKDDISDLRLITSDLLLDDLKCGIGAGLRMDIWITLLKMDIAKHTDMMVLSPETYYHISFGAEF
ncbi:MAG: hypothetical protein AB7T10_04005 [bacterium]